MDGMQKATESNEVGPDHDSETTVTNTTNTMSSSVLRFTDMNFVVGTKSKTQTILSDVSGTVKWGHALAIMGPSGAGKTTLISTLSMDAHFGQAYGRVTLNGVPLTDEIFKSHCYVVKQHDKHWPYLTCRETLLYGASLFRVAATDEEKNDIVDEVIGKMGLTSCKDTRNARLSGGQQRRLSIGVALLKKPTLLLLDEPTSSLDSASAEAIMKEIVRVAKEENIIIVATIHQPSTKVYNGFDKLMLMSRGREAFSGDVADAIPYFESIGYSCPQATNPAEYFLDLVNSDFTEESKVEKILEDWQYTRSDLSSTHHSKASAHGKEGQYWVAEIASPSLLSESLVMLRRHFTLIVRDPILYMGRCAVFLVACSFFGFVYWNARDYEQDQAINKMWLIIWYVGVPTNMGVVAVYSLNDEFKSILRETKNGMTSGLSYVLAKTVLVIPIFFAFALFALGIPAFAIQDYPADAFGWSITLFAILLFVFESVAEALSVWFDDPIVGMLQFMNFWFGAFLFGGFLIPLRDMYWPFKLFYYAMPYSYYVRSSMYQLFSRSTFEACVNSLEDSAVCVDSTSGLDVLEGLRKVYPLMSTKDNTARDAAIMIAIGLFYKLLYVVGMIVKTRQVTAIKAGRPPSIHNMENSETKDPVVDAENPIPLVSNMGRDNVSSSSEVSL